MKYIKLFDSYDGDEYWNNYLNNLNNAIKKRREEYSEDNSDS